MTILKKTIHNSHQITKHLYITVICALLLQPVTWADAPEDQVWDDAPGKREPAKIGPEFERVPTSKYQQIVYVSQSWGSREIGDGSSAQPFRSLSHAISQITDAGAEKRYAILVAGGTYSKATIKMKQYVDLYGGFEPPKWNRNIFEYRTILNGKQKRRVVEAADNARIDGFVISGGASQGHGGGILCHRTSPTITNNIITGNVTLEPPGFVHDPDRRRHVGNDGAGIACVDGANPVIANNIIYDNATHLGNGGAIVCRDDACPKIIYNVIWGNETGVKDIHETRTGNGAGIVCFAGSLPIINNNLIANNNAKGASDGGGIYCEYNSSPEIYYNFILGNSAEDDGGATEIMKSSQPLIHANVFAGNYTDGGGGGIRLSDQGLAIITDNLIVHNTGKGKGGGVACTNAWMICKNNIIADNKSKRAAGLVYYVVNWIHLRPPVITDNIIWNNDDEQIEATSDAIVVLNNIQGGFESGRNTDKDPMFKNDGLKGTFAAAAYDLSGFVTTLSTQKQQFASNDLAGRVIRVGSKWSLIKSNTADEIVIWGKPERNKLDFEILPTYTQQ